VKVAAGLSLLTILVAAPPAVATPSGTLPPAPAELPALPSFTVTDRPGDSGNAILLVWQDPPDLPADAVVEIRRAEPPAYEWIALAQVKPGVGRYVDSSARDGAVYRYEARVRSADTADSSGIAGATGPAVLSNPVASHDNWFRSERANSFIAMILFTGFILISIQVARTGRPLFIRKIAGLSAVDEAIGRATELGRKVLFVPGIASVNDIQTVASLAILGHIARASARYGTDLDCPNRDPLTFVSARETVRSAFMTEGRPDLYREEMVNYVTYDQFAYTAAVSGRMVREKPAANFLIGHFFAEALIMAETGQSTGAIQIAGTADPAQLPFFVAACDYTLIGEELFAAGAYLSREPILLGSIRGQDLAKALLLLFGIVGIAASTFGITWFATVLNTK
jgi:uncharacterized protein DUF6754